jgi:hypothetical protein
MTKLKQTWREIWLAKEEGGSSGGSNGEEEQEMASARGDPNPSEKEDRLGEVSTRMDISMVFMIPAEFRAPTENVAESALGAERAMFEKPENPDAHMRPLFIWRTWSDTCS